jgi:hypothetical protein
MDRSRTLLLAIAALSVASCGQDLGTEAPTEFDGIKYTAETVLVPTGGQTLVSVVVTLQNTGTASQTRTYPASCPVRILLFRQADDVLMYDERRRECGSTPVATITIDGLSSKQLQSGVRFPSSIAGDSLPFTTYNVRAAVMTEGTKTVLINAGTYILAGG